MGFLFLTPSVENTAHVMPSSCTLSLLLCLCVSILYYLACKLPGVELGMTLQFLA